MIIDAHVHYTPPDLRDRLPTIGEPYWELLLNSPQSIQGWVSAETMLDDMDRANVDKVILVGEYFQQQANCVARNNAVLELINRYPERIAAFAIVNPNAGQAALDEVGRCLDAGMIGVGELNFYAQNFTPETPAFRELCLLCAERNRPINLHGSEPVGGYYLGKSTTPLHSYYQLAADFPSLKLIYAHWGGGLPFYELMPRTRKTLSNVYYDTAASPLLYPTGRIFNTVLSCIDPEKIIYGSDYPLKLYPSRMDEPNFDFFLTAIRKFVPDEALQAQILGGNVLQLLSQQAETTLNLVSPIGEKIVGMMAVQTAVNVWPQTVEIFGRYQIPTQTAAWEPIVQAAAACGLNAAQQQDLLQELNFCITR
jgi:predicted TIM-barrel fold metal-dependent hydrolase